ncbi:carbohydrate ABC transporter permease [Devosia sp.]|uniref:carbohydrate ABC transporter permease n=1 Tax=Devosia sp. TaxID=1871048 RepID=UPI003A940D3A
MLLFGIFVLMPLGASVYYAFTFWDGFGAPQWAGLANFARAVTDLTYLYSYVHVVIYIFATLVFEVTFGLVMAVVLDSNRRPFSLMRGMFFSPVVLSMSAAGVLWTFVLDYRTGLLNSVLKSIGLGDFAQPWMSQPETALLFICIVSGWKYAGFYMVIFFAALRRIPRNIYEAARLDGAGELQQFFMITVPLLKQNMLVCVLLAVTGGFAGFDLFFTMSNGQPFGATEVPATWIIKQAFDQNQIGYGIALTVILTLVVSVISIIYLRLSERTNVTRF